MSRGGVLGTAHSGADRYRRRLLAAAGLSDNLLFANLNTTVTIKSSPPKDAAAVAQLAIVSGYLTKRNEQHGWQRRFCTLVPQSLLYYFEDEDSDTPRGIIDLEYYTDISCQPNNVVRIASAGGCEKQRTFYFQCDTEEEMNGWMSSLTRERYFVLRDERDAYQELQQDFQAQTHQMAEVMHQVQEEEQTTRRRLDETKRAEAELATQLQALLASVTNQKQPPGEEVAALKAAGEDLVTHVSHLEGELAETEAATTTLAEKLREQNGEVAAIRAELRAEETLLGREQREKQREMDSVAELRSQLEEGEVNLAIIVGARDSAEAKVGALQDQKKVLVREVKAARKAAPPPPVQPSQPPLDKTHRSASEGSLGDQEETEESHNAVNAAARKIGRSGSALFRKLADAPKKLKKATLSSEELQSLGDEEASPISSRRSSGSDFTAEVLICKRCTGSVEGPRNSTCVCAEPLLGEDTDQSASAALAKAQVQASRMWKSFTVPTLTRPKTTLKDDGPEAAVKGGNQNPPSPHKEDPKLVKL